jgi:type IV pilus assembly protein PilM
LAEKTKLTMNFLTKKIISLDDRTFALDLSDLSIKIFQIEKKGSYDSIRSFCDVDVPEGYISDGRIVEKEKVAQLIKSAVKKAGPKKINTSKVVCSLPESKAFLRKINIPQMELKEAHEAVKWEIEASIPLTCEQVYYDWQFLDISEGKQNILTAAVSKEIVDEVIETLIAADLDPYGLEVESIACVRSLIPEDSSPEEISLIVDLGSLRTSFIISEGNIPFFTSSIPFSSKTITDSISKTMKVNLKEAEKIKKNQGIEHSFENSSIFNDIKALLENLSVEIEKTIDFYQSMSRKKSGVSRIIICGGGANLRGLIPYLTTRLCKEVRMGDPWINLRMGNSLPIISKEDSVSYATAIGLAIKK